ncbi:hypothetical protein [Bacillus horti]|uniref:Sec-independent protein translocase protein TatA n=1 Tax=Caldalkalibacillus horti TaxID=77523 RepID=A0ABT9W1A9_9BACI|nr:hypothetical protein [Bacillus horti]MDQ0167048.1 Sec-independent protein translocase protein TatA [Bacillus horti]
MRRNNENEPSNYKGRARNNDPYGEEEWSDHEEPNDFHREQPVRERHRAPWYNRGWVWMIIVVVALFVLLIGFSWLTDGLGTVGESIDQQTEAIRDQTNVLETQNSLLANIRDGIQNLMQSIRDSVNQILAAI